MTSASDDLVPCEMCGTSIPFDQYIAHLENCYISTRIVNQNQTIPTNPRIQIRRIGSNNIDGIEETIQHNMTDFMNTIQTEQPDFDTMIRLLPMFFNTSNDFNFNLQLHRVANIQDSNQPVVDTSNAYITLPTDVTGSSDEEICSICYEWKDRTLVKTTCNHIYCKECIDSWLRKKPTCPICLKDLLS